MCENALKQQIACHWKHWVRTAGVQAKIKDIYLAVFNNVFFFFNNDTSLIFLTLLKLY